MILIFLHILIVLANQSQQICAQGGASIDGIYSGVMIFPYNDLNQGSINKYYYQQIENSNFRQNNYLSMAFSICSFEGSGTQSYYALSIKSAELQNSNTRISVILDFQIPSKKQLSLWTEIKISYIVVSQNMERNGYSYIWTYTASLDLKDSYIGGVVEGQLFNHQNNKGRCGFDGKYWNTDGCKLVNAVPVYHTYLAGFKFNPYDYNSVYELGFSILMINKFGQVTINQKQGQVDVAYNQNQKAGPRLKIDNFKTQLQTIKVSIIMSIVQSNSPNYPTKATSSITYSGIYYKGIIQPNGYKIIQRKPESKTENIYFYQLPGIKYYIFGISRFVAKKARPRQNSIALKSQVINQNLLFIESNFRIIQDDIMFNGDFYYKKLQNICSLEKNRRQLLKSEVSSIVFESINSKNGTYSIKNVEKGDFPASSNLVSNEVAVEYFYNASENFTQQVAWVTIGYYNNIKEGSSYEFEFSINQIGPNGIIDQQAYEFVIYINDIEFYRNLLIGTTGNDKIDGIKKGLNVRNSSIEVKVSAKIIRQRNKSLQFRVSMKVAELRSMFNPVSQCCNSVCPKESGLDIEAVPVSCVICDSVEGFEYNYRIKGCACQSGYYFKSGIFPKCLACQASLCGMCEKQNSTKCIQCVFGAYLDLDKRTCRCYPEFVQKDNRCLLNDTFEAVCLKYGFCNRNYQVVAIQKPTCLVSEYDTGRGFCSPCNQVCKTCVNINSCLSCDDKSNRYYQDGLCICKYGYFQMEYQNKSRSCLPCSPQCSACQFSAQTCIQCDKSKFQEKVLNDKGFFTCKCISGYHFVDKAICKQSNCMFDKFCSTCQQIAGNNLCISCISQLNRILQLPEHICVCMKGYFQNSNKQCERCKDGCAQCINATTCLACVIGSKAINDGSCLCPNATFYRFDTGSKIGYCKSCQKYCQSCFDEKTCKKCASTFTLTNDNGCGCPVSTYYNSSVQLCASCPEGCYQCINSTQCRSCRQYFLLEEKACVENCQMAFYKTQKQCFKCGDGCIYCQHQRSCNQCEKDYIPYQSQCYKTCPQGTIRNGIKKQCIPCNAPCKTCANHPSQCESCQSGQGFLQQVGSSKTCLRQCPSGMYPLKGVCEFCDPSCSSCLGDKLNCIQCHTSYYLFQGKCLQQCPGVLYNQDRCLNYCPDSYYKIQNNKCLPCSNNCKTCENNEQNCLTCYDNLVIKNGKCIINCQNNEYQKNGRCLKCSQLCRSCNGNAYNCTSCINTNFTLIQNKCQKKCQISQYYSLGTDNCQKCLNNCRICTNKNYCNQCQVDYVLDVNTGVCIQLCLFPCQTCFSRNLCKTCRVGYFLIEEESRCVSFCPTNTRMENNKCVCYQGFYYNRSCIQNCPPAMYSNTITRKCQNCTVANCLSCSDNISCQKCLTSYALSANKLACVFQDTQSSKCPLGFAFQNNVCTKICKSANEFFINTPSSGSLCIYGACPQGYTPNNENICMLKSLESTIQCFGGLYNENGQCKYKCSSGYFAEQNSKTCKLCDKTCLSCKNTAFQCQSCNLGFLMVKQKCTKIYCSLNQYYFNGKCYKNCPQGTYYDGISCSYLCPLKHYYFLGLCYAQCPEQGPLIEDFSCTYACSEKYSQINGECTLKE